MFKFLQKIIAAIVYASLIASLTFIVLSLISLHYSKETLTLSSFYSAMTKYSGLYKFTFIVLAANIAIEQLKLSQENYKKTLNQLKLTEDDIFVKKDKEIRDNTLTQCSYYFTELQLSFRELSEKGVLDNLPVFCSFKGKVYRRALLDYSPSLDKIVQANVSKCSKDILVVLYKYEAYSTLFIHGNFDLTLGKEIVGHVFCRQVELMLPIIAVYREDDNTIFAKNILKLFEVWDSE